MAAVADLLREAAASAVLPVFGRRDAAPEEKAPGEWVTVADRAVEDLLTPALAALAPGSVVVGEEAVSADARVLGRLGSRGEVWLLDPLDGTANFVAGRPPFALMAALLRDGEPVASWMLDPLSGRLAAAQRGAGAWLDGQRVTAPAGAPPLSALRGAASRRFLPPELASHVASAEPLFAELGGGTRCAGADYPDVAAGVQDFVLYWRTLPWDHAPGALFVTEAGGVARRLDGTRYRAAQHTRPGLLVARDEHVWRAAARALVPPGWGKRRAPGAAAGGGA